jgi:hypothetical protein
MKGITRLSILEQVFMSMKGVNKGPEVPQGHFLYIYIGGLWTRKNCEFKTLGLHSKLYNGGITHKKKKEDT